MTLTGVVYNIVDIDLDTTLVAGIQQLTKILLRTELRIYGIVVRNVITVVRIGGVNRREPQSTHTQLLDVVELRDDTLEVTHTIAIRVSKGIDQNLIDHLIGRLTIPLVGLCHYQVRIGRRSRLAHRQHDIALTGSFQRDRSRTRLTRRVGSSHDVQLRGTIRTAGQRSVAPIGIRLGTPCTGRSNRNG